MLGERTRISGQVGAAKRVAESALSPRCQAWWKCNDGTGDVITDASPNARHISKGSSPVAAATVWANPGRATFPGSSLGWSRSGSGLFGSFSNLAGGAMLWMFRISAAVPPQGTDRMILGGQAVGGSDTVHVRLRPAGTTFNVGDDGTVAFGAYPSGSGVTVVQVTSPVAQADRSVCVGQDRHVAILVDGAAKTHTILYGGKTMISVAQPAAHQAIALNAAPTFYLGTVLAQAGNTESIQLFDVQLYASDTAPPVQILNAVAKVALRPYSFLTDEDWS